MIWAIVITFIIIVIILIIPILVKNRINKALKEMNGYSGHIDHLYLQVFKSRVLVRNTVIHGAAIIEPGMPLLQIPVIIINFKWGSLFKKILDLNIKIENPRVNIPIGATTPEETTDSKVADQDIDIKSAIENLVSFKVNLEIAGGEIYIANHGSERIWDITLRNLNVEVRNFSNQVTLSEVCYIRGTCELNTGGGTINLNMALRPLKPNLTLGVNLELKSINLASLNDLFRAYGKVDVSLGFLDFATEVIVAEKAFDGYIKIVIDDLEIVGSEDLKDNVLQKIWERVLNGIVSLLIGRKNNQFAMVIPIKGRLDNPQESAGTVVAELVRKAFIKEITPLIEVRPKTFLRKAIFKTKKLLGRLNPHRTMG